MPTMFSPGFVIDGADGTEGTAMGVDVDYTHDYSTVTAQFSGFTSHLHGVMSFEWAVGTSAGGEEVQPFMEHGINHHEEENVPGYGKISLWFIRKDFIFPVLHSIVGKYCLLVSFS